MSQDGARGRHTGRSLAGGRYQLRDLLGQGGMASVHLAYDSVLDRQVAIKTLHTELSREPAFRERFRREAQAVAKLTHTNIVSVFDTGEDTLSDGGVAVADAAPTPYLVMELVEGRPLGSVLAEDVRQCGAMPADKALRITADVLAALEVSHEEGLVHRDIKPGNVMVTRRGVVKVMDFGIARAMQSGVTSMTQTGVVVGTPQYLSPEQALGRGVDARSDLYSVGVMLFQLVTGRLPFDADSPLAIAYAHVHEEPPAPSSLNRALPPAVDALVARALKKNPGERFPSAEAMREECLRVARSVGEAAPDIAAEAGAAGGAGAGPAVFPPVAPATPPGPAAGTGGPSYQPGPAPAPAPGHAPGTVSYGGLPPAAPAPAAYGRPHQGGHPAPCPQPRTPAPAPYAAPPTPPPYAAVSTPPPYTAASTPPPPVSGSPRRGKSDKPVVIGSLIVALIAVGGLITALVMSGGDDTPRAAPSATATPSDGSEGGGESDATETIDPRECTDPEEGFSDPSRIQMPSFKYKNIDSVRECLQAADWNMRITEVDEDLFGKGTVMDQYPSYGSDVDPRKMPEILLSVSTGKPPS